MPKSSNATIVRKLIDAFDKGDVDKAASMFADKVDFKSPVTYARHNMITWAKPRRTPDEVASFFKEMGEVVQTEKTEIISILTQDDRVAVEGRNRGTVRSNGRGYDHNWIMVFEIKKGKITKSHHYYDTADLIPALSGRD